MKQHITLEQLSELSKPSKKKLMNSIDNIFYLNAQKQFPGVATTHWHEDKNYLLSIGQMIELLGDKYRDWYMDFQNTTCLWSVKLGYLPDIEEPRLVHSEEELCDALWEAVKELLNED